MKTQITLGILSGLSIILSCIAIALHFSEITISDFSLVLGFIGVLATFIVVSNSVQLWKFESKMDYIEKTYNPLFEKMVAATKKNTLTMVDFTLYDNKNKEPVIDLSQQPIDVPKKKNRISRAYNYALDLLPILPELYGIDGTKKDADGGNLSEAIKFYTELLTIVDTKDIYKEYISRTIKIIQGLPIEYQRKLEPITTSCKNILKKNETEKD